MPSFLNLFGVSEPLHGRETAHIINQDDFDSFRRVIDRFYVWKPRPVTNKPIACS